MLFDYQVFNVFPVQVSRCEKFGYGVMVTQVAATAPGVAALHRSGSYAPTHSHTQLHFPSDCDA